MKKKEKMKKMKRMKKIMKNQYLKNISKVLLKTMNR